ncbi:MAG TPA: sugar ABC transporter permease [Candidatus Limnocylindria bacterium]|nr:sugar ABC transporter permease [Candidatus Limnocylindria bacterium]
MKRVRARTEDLLPYALLLPSILFLALLILIPMVQALLLAIQAESGGLTTEYLERMRGDVNFSDAWRNTLLLIVLIVPLQIVLALAMALLIHSRFRGHEWFLYVYAIPLAISDLASGILWLSIFTERGYLNTVAEGIGIIDAPQVFLSFENTGGLLAAIVIAESWRATSIVMVILVAGLQLIPRDYFEAADLFGANRIRRTIHVVLPLLRPSLQSALIIRTIFAFQTFAVVLALAGRNMPVIAAEAYNWYANNRNAHLAASYALLLLGLTIVFTVVYLRVLGLREAEVKR